MAIAPDASAASLKTTPLNALHKELGARMVPFAGYEMPVQYPAGIIAEHSHTRAAAGLFDVSHMGQAVLHGGDPAAAFERLVPGDITGLAPGAMRYSLLLNKEGGILDDLMVTRPGEPGSRIRSIWSSTRPVRTMISPISANNCRARQHWSAPTTALYWRCRDRRRRPCWRAWRRQPASWYSCGPRR